MFERIKDDMSLQRKLYTPTRYKHPWCHGFVSRHQLAEERVRRPSVSNQHRMLLVGRSLMLIVSATASGEYVGKCAHHSVSGLWERAQFLMQFLTQARMFPQGLVGFHGHRSVRLSASRKFRIVPNDTCYILLHLIHSQVHVING